MLHPYNREALLSALCSRNKINVVMASFICVKILSNLSGIYCKVNLMADLNASLMQSLIPNLNVSLISMIFCLQTPKIIWLHLLSTEWHSFCLLSHNFNEHFLMYPSYQCHHIIWIVCVCTFVYVCVMLAKVLILTVIALCP